jgi:uncharacterized membrane protein YfcA
MSMLPYYALLCLTAFLAGIVNALAGGGTLLTFPALNAALIALGTVANPSVCANGTSTVALVPAALSSAWAYRRELGVVRKWLKLLVLPSIVGGTAGALLVTWYPDAFEGMIPWLILTATVLFTLQPLVIRRLKKLDDAPLTQLGMALLVLAQLGVAIYGGYFGAGIGILMLSTLGLMGLKNLHEMNALKVVLGGCINGLAIVVFVVQDIRGQDTIHWPFALAMMGSAVAGGYVGANYGRRFPPKYVRIFVVAVGFALSLFYFWKTLAG